MFLGARTFSVRASLGLSFPSPLPGDIGIVVITFGLTIVIVFVNYAGILLWKSQPTRVRVVSAPAFPLTDVGGCPRTLELRQSILLSPFSELISNDIGSRCKEITVIANSDGAEKSLRSLWERGYRIRWINICFWDS